MITLEQIQLLDKKIKDAVELISSLRDEKKALSAQIAHHEETISSLEAQLSSFKSDSDQIESGFNDVLSQLEQVEASDEPGQQESLEATAEVVVEEETIEEEVVEGQAVEETIIESSEEPVAEEETNVESSASSEDSLFDEPQSNQDMQFEEAAEPASEEPGIDEGFPLTPESNDEVQDSQVNHSEQQDNEESRSPQDLDIF